MLCKYMGLNSKFVAPSGSELFMLSTVEMLCARVGTHKLSDTERKMKQQREQEGGDRGDIKHLFNH